MLNYANYARSKEEVIVISSAENVIKACKDLGIEYLQHNRFKIRELILNKKEVLISLDEIYGIIGDSVLHFSHTQIAVFCFLLVKRMLKSGSKVKFHDFEYVYDKLRIQKLSRCLITAYIDMMLLKGLYRIPLELRSAGSTFPISLNMKYIKDNVTELIKEKDTYFEKILSGFKNNHLKCVTIDSLFIDQGFGITNFYKQEKLLKVMQIIKKHNIKIKEHPKLSSEYLANYEGKLPNYLPVEFYFSSVNHCVISCHSSSLITATYFENLKVISLIDIIGVKTEFMKEVKRDLLKKGNGRIEFPKNYKELDELFNDN